MSEAMLINSKAQKDVKKQKKNPLGRFLLLVLVCSCTGQEDPPGWEGSGEKTTTLQDQGEKNNHTL